MATRNVNAGFPGIADARRATVSGYEVRIPGSICEIVEWLPLKRGDAKCRAFLLRRGHVLIDWDEGPLYRLADSLAELIKDQPLDPHQLTGDLLAATNVIAFSWSIGIRQQPRTKAGKVIEQRFHIPAELDRVAGISRHDGAGIVFSATPKALYAWNASAVAAAQPAFSDSLGAVLDRPIAALKER